MLLFISLFLSWYTYTSTDATIATPGSSVSLTALSSQAGGWRFLILVMSLLVFLYLFIRSMSGRGIGFPSRTGSS